MIVLIVLIVLTVAPTELYNPWAWLRYFELLKSHDFLCFVVLFYRLCRNVALGKGESTIFAIGPENQGRTLLALRHEG